MSHDIIVQFHNLPKRYSCDQIWYKVHDVLIKLGARPTRILAYRCEASVGELDRSPSVHVIFQLPQVLHGTQVRWADVRASRHIVRLEPGNPPSLDGSDCELLRQLQAALLPEMSERMVSFRLACQAAPTAHPAYAVSVEALTPVAPQTQQAQTPRPQTTGPRTTQLAQQVSRPSL
ncbi:MAG TPA: hypothetical protein VIY54_05650 [Steroidobacteraceae bacterium]